MFGEVGICVTKSENILFYPTVETLENGLCIDVMW